MKYLITIVNNKGLDGWNGAGYVTDKDGNVGYSCAFQFTEEEVLYILPVLMKKYSQMNIEIKNTH